MIYICIPSYNEAETVGILLWKIRKVFAEFTREYQILVLDDGSTDATTEVLEPYKKVLPLTVLQHSTRLGYARSVEALLVEAVKRTDRPKRDSAIIMQADFTDDATSLAEMVRRLESGADLVVAESTVIGATRGTRWLRRWAPKLFRSAVNQPDLQDLVSGFMACRLITVRNAVRNAGGRLLTAEGWVANAELQARVGAVARRVASIETEERHELRQRDSRHTTFGRARALWSQRGTITIPPPAPEPERRPRRKPRRPARVK